MGRQIPERVQVSAGHSAGMHGQLEGGGEVTRGLVVWDPLTTLGPYLQGGPPTFAARPHPDFYMAAASVTSGQALLASLPKTPSLSPLKFLTGSWRPPWPSGSPCVGSAKRPGLSGRRLTHRHTPCMSAHRHAHAGSSPRGHSHAHLPPLPGPLHTNMACTHTHTHSHTPGA